MQPITPELRNLLAQLSQHLQPEPDKNPSLLEIWDAWVESLDLSEVQDSHYHPARRQIIKAGNPLAADTGWFLGNPLAPKTYNERLWLLKRMAAWAVDEGLLSANPWRKIKPRKKTKEIIKPFSQNEAVRIIAGFEKVIPPGFRSPNFCFSAVAECLRRSACSGSTLILSAEKFAFANLCPGASTKLTSECGNLQKLAASDFSK